MTIAIQHRTKSMVIKIALFAIIVSFLLHLVVPISVIRNIAWALIVSLLLHGFDYFLLLPKRENLSNILVKTISVACVTLVCIFVIAFLAASDVSPEGQKYSQGLSFLAIYLPILSAIWILILSYIDSSKHL